MTTPATDKVVALTRIKTYVRRLASGKEVTVKEHDDSRNAFLRKAGIGAHHNGSNAPKGKHTQAGGEAIQVRRIAYESPQSSALPPHEEKPTPALISFYEQQIRTETNPVAKAHLQVRLKILKKLLRKLVDSPIPNIPGEHIVKHELRKHG